MAYLVLRIRNYFLCKATAKSTVDRTTLVVYHSIAETTLSEQRHLLTLTEKALDKSSVGLHKPQEWTIFIEQVLMFQCIKADI